VNISISIIGSEEKDPGFIPVTGTPLEALEEKFRVMEILFKVVMPHFVAS
jgi:hypothetical protein